MFQCGKSIDDCGNWGSATIYHIKEGDSTTPVTVYIPEHYELRGKDLKNLNRVEYYCLIHIKPIREKNKNKPGRSSSKQFKFGKGHKLESTHAQEIRSKQAIPIHLGKVPSLPILKNDFSKIEFEIWKKKANKFAAYFLTAFRPEDNNYDSNTYFNKLYYTWDDLESWIYTLENNKSFISTARLDMIYSTIYGMTTENTAKILLSKYRRRARDIWTDEDIVSYNSLRSNHKKDIYCANESMNGLINSMDINYLSTKS